MSPKARGGDKSRRRADLHNPAVGYGQPPMASRFKPGTSGNPKGRPKGSKNLRTLVEDAMMASIPLQEGEKTRRVSKFEGVVLRQLQSALKGNDKAALAVVNIALRLGFLEATGANPVEVTLSKEEQRILDELIARTSKP